MEGFTVFGVRTAATKAAIAAQINTLYPSTEGVGSTAVGESSQSGGSEHDNARAAIIHAVVNAGVGAPSAEENVDPTAKDPSVTAHTIYLSKVRTAPSLPAENPP